MGDTGDEGALDQDRRVCGRCASSLRNAPLSGVCAECGWPVDGSVRGDTLTSAAPEYLRRMDGGLSLVLRSILLAEILWLAAVFYEDLRAALGLSAAAQLSVAVIVCVSTLVLNAVGYFKFTEPDAGSVAREGKLSARRVLRIASLLTSVPVLLWIASAVSGVFSAAGTGPRAGGMAWGSELMMVGNVFYLGLVGAKFFACMIYARHLGSRVPDNVLMNRCRLYMCVIPLSVLVLAGGATVGFVVPLILGMLVAAGLCWHVLHRLRQHVRLALRAATLAEGSERCPN